MIKSEFLVLCLFNNFTILDWLTRLSTVQWCMAMMNCYQERLRPLPVVAFKDSVSEFQWRGWGESRRSSVSADLNAVNSSQTGSNPKALYQRNFLDYLCGKGRSLLILVWLVPYEADGGETLGNTVWRQSGVPSQELSYLAWFLGALSTSAVHAAGLGVGGVNLWSLLFSFPEGCLTMPLVSKL